MEAVAASLPPETYVVWTGLPLFPAECGPLPGQGNLPKHVRGVRIFPKTHAYPLASWMLGPLCRWLVERRLPLFIWHVELDWSSLRTLAQEFPELNIVVETQTQKIIYHDRPLFTVMRDCPKVMVEISNFVVREFSGICRWPVRRWAADLWIVPTGQRSVGAPGDGRGRGYFGRR